MKVLCRLLGHNWQIPYGFDLVMPILCARCGYDMDYAGAARRHHPELFGSAEPVLNIRTDPEVTVGPAKVRHGAF